jgi:hypothetical protein
MSQLPKEASVTSDVAPNHYGVSIGFEYDPRRDGNGNSGSYHMRTHGDSA